MLLKKTQYHEYELLSQKKKKKKKKTHTQGHWCQY